MKHILATLAVGLAILPFCTGSALANGCHRDVRLDRYGWHRHDGDCERINVDRERRYYREREEPRCFQKCKYVGPFKQCRTECN